MGTERTLEQKIAEATDKLNRLRQSQRKLEAGQKIIIGGMVIAEARRNKKIRDWLIETATKNATREADKNRISPLIDELKNLTEPTTHTSSSEQDQELPESGDDDNDDNDDSDYDQWRNENENG